MPKTPLKNHSKTVSEGQDIPNKRKRKRVAAWEMSLKANSALECLSLSRCKSNVVYTHTTSYYIYTYTYKC